MKSTEILNKIKTFLTEDKVEETKEETIEETQLETKVELAQAKLENGTVVESESFKEGDEIFIVTDDDKVAMPVGEYVMEDGKLLVVKEEGIIADYREVSDEVPAEEKEMAEEDMAEDDEAAVDDWAGMEKRIKNLEDAIADIKGRLGEKEDYKKLEDEVKQQLSETPAAEPIIHSPEVKKKFNLKYAQNRQQNSLDRVLNKMYNN
jgi:delta 1-pyrroline-5-carboxylate dehydrogenase